MISFNAASFWPTGRCIGNSSNFNIWKKFKNCHLCRLEKQIHYLIISRKANRRRRRSTSLLLAYARSICVACDVVCSVWWPKWTRCNYYIAIWKIWSSFITEYNATSRVSYSTNTAWGVCVCVCEWLCHIARLFAQNIIIIIINLNNAWWQQHNGTWCACVCESEFYVFRCDNLFQFGLVCRWHMGNLSHMNIVGQNASARIYLIERYRLAKRFAAATVAIGDGTRSALVFALRLNTKTAELPSVASIIAIDLNIFQSRIHKSIVWDNNNT